MGSYQLLCVIIHRIKLNQKETILFLFTGPCWKTERCYGRKGTIWCRSHKLYRKCCWPHTAGTMLVSRTCMPCCTRGNPSSQYLPCSFYCLGRLLLGLHTSLPWMNFRKLLCGGGSYQTKKHVQLQLFKQCSKNIIIKFIFLVICCLCPVFLTVKCGRKQCRGYRSFRVMSW